MDTNSSANFPVNPSNSNFNVAAIAATELAAAGTIATLATQATAMGIGQVVVATIGAGAVSVSLPAVLAVGAAGCLGVSLGTKIVNAINGA